MTTESTLDAFTSRRYRYRRAWNEYQSCIRLLDQKSDLEQLVRWAARKRLSGPQFHYTTLLQDIERQLVRKQIHSPQVLTWARILYAVSEFLFAKESRYRKGSAKKYRLRNRVQSWRKGEMSI